MYHFWTIWRKDRNLSTAFCCFQNEADTEEYRVYGAIKTMGAALYIVLENRIPDVDPAIDGKMLSKYEKQLATAAKRLGVRSLMEFFSTNADEAEAFLGEDGAGIDIPDAQWFSADEGLKTVDALLSEVNVSPVLKAATDDLLGCQRLLREAKKHEIKWRFAIDF